MPDKQEKAPLNDEGEAPAAQALPRELPDDPGVNLLDYLDPPVSPGCPYCGAAMPCTAHRPGG